MSVTARTFQLLYIVRERAQQDLTTKLPHFAEFIAGRRGMAPSVYDKAYISPSSIQDLLLRMSTAERLLTVEDGEYSFTPQGSQMADLLVNIDACSSHFIDGYKEQVVHAALQQRARLGQPPATQRDVAAIANISLDSARRGLVTLVDSGIVDEDKDGRSAIYSLKPQPPATVTQMGQPPVVLAVHKDPVREALESINDDDLLPGPTPVEPPDPEDDEDVPLSLDSILGDDKPDLAPRDFAHNSVPDKNLKAQENPSKEMGVSQPSEWSLVSREIQEGHLLLARVAGVPLNEYMAALLHLHQAKVREVLFEGFDEG